MRLWLTFSLLAAAAPAAAQSVTDTSLVKPIIALPRMTLGVRDSIAKISRDQLGSRYRLGALKPGRAFDCSSLVQYVMSLVDVMLPRTAAEQARVGVPVPRDSAQLLPGDLLTFGRGKQITHIGIYVGNGRYVHASSKKRTVVEVPLPRLSGRGGQWWKGARRILPAETAALDTAATAPATSALPVSTTSGL
ncbi:MAG TPA: C40 family peptidase [Gemmatimonadales bacterium]|nr:C40 family peptidase [Gemmatimonadales bacterium]